MVPKFAGLHWNAEVELDREKPQNQLKFHFDHCNSGRDHV